MIQPVMKVELRPDMHFQPKNLKSLFENIGDHVWLKSMFALLAVGFDWVYGADKHYLYAIASLIIFDTVTGFFLACKRGELSSYGFYRFSAKVLVYFIMTATCKLMDKVLEVEIASPIMFSFLAITEGISVLENVASLGFPLPKRIHKYMKIFKEAVKEIGEE